MALDPELSVYLVRIYELMRRQYQATFDLDMKIRSIEMVFRANPSFAEMHDQTQTMVPTQEMLQLHQIGLVSFDVMIHELSGIEGPEPAEA